MAKKAIYVGVFLSPAEKEKLLAWAPPTHEEIYAHHTTLCFKPSSDLLKSLPIGEMVTLTITGTVDLEGCQAVTVGCRDGLSQNPIPHITLSTSPGVPPKTSNQIVDKAVAVNPLVLEGRVGIFTGKDIQYDLEGLL